MTAIAGIASPDQFEQVEGMLDKMSHRGGDWRDVRRGRGKTFGALGLQIDERAKEDIRRFGLVSDAPSQTRLAQAQATGAGFELRRDMLGVAPLYYGWIDGKLLCFATEVKGLLEVTRDVHELPPGAMFDGKEISEYYCLAVKQPLQRPEDELALELRRRLEKSVRRCIGDGQVGAWLSGGLDSSTMAALARPYVDKLHTFAAGLPGAPDLAFALMVADYIQSEHHEVIIQPEDILAVLPEVIYYLESFDALLVRSSVMNYLVAKRASDYVPAVFSGEGGDELFAGYGYLKDLAPSRLPDELVEIAGRLHNTALQRVDRCSSAHGTVAHVGFLDPEVVSLALEIPVEYKLCDGVEKSILRHAMADALPDPILDRTKAKFWEGAGVEDLLAEHADEQISDADFATQRHLPDGSRLNTKEELFYYRLFREHFGEFTDLSWMGRTKGAPVS
ncbi:MAG: hypothetical protein JXB85_14820 [Anaerolineales bacterium]|nr:hypothetical protein [Anaerolineales bacterium]